MREDDKEGNTQMTETTVDFTLSDVVREIRRLAAESPDFIYTSPNYDGQDGDDGTCLYVHGEDRDQPGCIVGQALARLGYVVPVDLEGSHAGAVLGLLFGFDSSKIPPSIPPVEARWITAVQRRQDERHPWGSAVAIADSHFPLVAA